MTGQGTTSRYELRYASSSARAAAPPMTALRFYELGHDYRYEKIGVVHGLTRMRGFTQDDSFLTGLGGGCRRSSSSCRSVGFRPQGLLSRAVHTRRGRQKEGQVHRFRTRTGRLPRRPSKTPAPTDLDLVPDLGDAAFYGPKVSVR